VSASRGTSDAAGDPAASRLARANLFDKVSVGRISETIVDQIRQLMYTGQLRPGDRLPAERDLCERFGVSRVTVREALRTLESSGLVEIRVGARGGAFVLRASSLSQLGSSSALKRLNYQAISAQLAGRTFCRERFRRSLLRSWR